MVSDDHEMLMQLVSDVTQASQYDNAHVGGRVVRSISHQGATSMTVNWAAFAFSQSFPLFSGHTLSPLGTHVMIYGYRSGLLLLASQPAVQ